MGGAAAILAAAERPFAAAVTFYGNGVTEGSFGAPPLTELITLVRGGWLGLYGEMDEWIPADEVDALEAAALKAHCHTELVRYPGAGHGFNCDERESFHAASATDAWRRTLEFLSEFAQ
jgi:carboxymethylenebutenolidase